MARFRFKFDSVLKLRKNRQEEALRGLGAAQRAYQLELERKRELLADLEKSLGRREALGQAPTAIQVFRLEQDFITGTKQRLVRQEQAIVRASRGVEKALRTYLAARRQARMMETLYERHYREFRKDVARRELAEQDELTVMRHRLKEEAS